MATIDNELDSLARLLEELIEKNINLIDLDNLEDSQTNEDEENNNDSD